VRQLQLPLFSRFSKKVDLMARHQSGN
jgi:hypothetical protein